MQSLAQCTSKGAFVRTRPGAGAPCFNKPTVVSTSVRPRRWQSPWPRLLQPSPSGTQICRSLFDQAWGTVDAQTLAPQLFAMSLFPYLGFLYHLTRSGKAPKLTLAGFYFLLVFVGATIPAGIYAKTHYGTSLANVDWLHGSAESLLTITNLLIVLGLRQGIRDAKAAQQQDAAGAPATTAAVEAAPVSVSADGDAA